LVVVTINGRANTNSPYGLLYAILDVSDFNSVPAIISKKYFAHPSGYNFYPYSTVIDEGRDVIYTCGHSDDIITSSPVAWPNIGTDKSAFISRTDMNTWNIDFQFYNTSTSGADYDMF